MADFILEFKLESEQLAEEMTEVLEECEQGCSPDQLGRFAQFADRIMGAAKTLALNHPQHRPILQLIGAYTQICKILGYKSSQLKSGDPLQSLTVAFLLDATDLLTQMLALLGGGGEKPAKLVTATFLDRLQWVSSQYSKKVSGSIPMTVALPTETVSLDELIQKLREKKA